MKKTKLLIGTLSTVLCLSLASCDTRPFYELITGFEASRDAFNECLENTFNHKNMTITYENHHERTEYKEMVLGDTSYLFAEQYVYSEGKGWFYVTVLQTWCFVNENGEKIVAKEETPWNEGTGTTSLTQQYYCGEKAYEENYKSYIRYFDFVNKVEEWIEPFVSTSEGKENYDNTSIYWEKYNYTVKNPDDLGDMFVYWSRYLGDDEDEEIYAHIWGGVDRKTDLCFQASSSFNLPDGCGPYNGDYTSVTFQMTYDDVKKIDIPDISGWEDMTDK